MEKALKEKLVEFFLEEGMELNEEKVRSGIAEKLTRFLVNEGVVLLPLKLDETYYYFDEDEVDDWCEGALKKVVANTISVSKSIGDEDLIFEINYNDNVEEFNTLKESYFNSKSETLASWAKYYESRGE